MSNFGLEKFLKGEKIKFFIGQKSEIDMLKKI